MASRTKLNDIASSLFVFDKILKPKNMKKDMNLIEKKLEIKPSKRFQENVKVP